MQMDGKAPARRQRREKLAKADEAMHRVDERAGIVADAILEHDLDFLDVGDVC